jgi:hypothetical protein
LIARAGEGADAHSYIAEPTLSGFHSAGLSTHRTSGTFGASWWLGRQSEISTIGCMGVSDQGLAADRIMDHTGTTHTERTHHRL